MRVQEESRNRYLEFGIAAIAGILLFIAFTFWGGVPTDERLAEFWVQIVILFVVSCVFIFVTWHLLLRPLPAKHKTPDTIPLPLALKQVLSIMLAAGGLSLVVAPFWDELWHRQYGIPFGEDFFWRPHLLIYFGFGMAILSGFGGLFYLLRSYKGTFQQRFRTNILVGLAVLNAAFLMYVVPADPIWHIIYGRDLSSWSIPHLLLLISIGMMMLLAVVVHLSNVPEYSWRTILDIRFSDALPLLMFAGIMMPWLQILMIDWDQVVSGDASRLVGRFRPEWLLACNVLFTSTFVGILATRTLRSVGSATLVGLIALGLRYSMIQIFEAETMQFAAWVVALAPLIAIDIWTYYSVFVNKGEASWITMGLVVALAMLINILVIRNIYNVDTSNIIVYGIAVLVTGLGMSWFSYQIADLMGSGNSRKVIENQPRYAPMVSIGALGGFVLFVIFFIVTATPPA